jgi:hypothetical protein
MVATYLTPLNPEDPETEGVYASPDGSLHNGARPSFSPATMAGMRGG